MNNYEKICDILSQWCYALVSYNNTNESRLYKFIYWNQITYNVLAGDMVLSNINNIDMSYVNRHFKDDIINHNIKDIKPIWIKPKILSVWDTVIILDSLKQVWTYESFDTAKKVMVWKKYQIRSIEDDSYWLSYTIRNNWTNYQFPSWTICKCDPDPIDVIEIWWVKYSKEEFQNAVKNLNPIN